MGSRAQRCASENWSARISAVAQRAVLQTYQCTIVVELSLLLAGRGSCSRSTGEQAAQKLRFQPVPITNQMRSARKIQLRSNPSRARARAKTFWSEGEEWGRVGKRGGVQGSRRRVGGECGEVGKWGGFSADMELLRTRIKKLTHTRFSLACAERRTGNY